VKNIPILLVAAYTLGCKVNQCDTEAVLGRLVGIGCTVRNFNQHADLYIINTCTVTHTSDKKSRQMIRRARKQNPNALVAVCGCMAKSDPAIADVLGVDFVFDARKPDEFVKMVADRVGQLQAKPEITESVYKITATRTRAFVKIQDGCDRFCSYCIVPYVRGKPVSRPVEDILAEISGLIATGVQEIVLTGIQAASYGEDNCERSELQLLSSDDLCLPQGGLCPTERNGINAITFAGLVKQVLDFDNLKRLRLSSIDPCAVTDEFLSVVASSQVLCDHFHLSLQSGCDATLARMNRRYTSAQYAKIVDSLLKIRPNAAITTDIIVGFPGETDDDFAESLDFAQRIGFASIHVFEYSKREGTPAAGFANQIADHVKTERSKRLRELAATLQTNFYNLQIGKRVSVLFEMPKPANTRWQGHSSNYCPVEVTIADCSKNLANTIHQVKITACTPDGLIGKYNKAEPH